VLSLLSFALALIAILFARYPARVSFNQDWPDAIKCEMSEAGEMHPDKVVFYFAGLSLPRNKIGSVAVYFTPGGANYRWQRDDVPDPSGNGFKRGELYYVPHLIWFTPTANLIDPRDWNVEGLDVSGRNIKSSHVCSGSLSAEAAFLATQDAASDRSAPPLCDCSSGGPRACSRRF
jgi:hypothetical protein